MPAGGEIPGARETEVPPFCVPAISIVRGIPKAVLVGPYAGQKCHARDALAPTHLQVGGVQVEVSLLLQGLLPPTPLLLPEAAGR